MASDSVKITDPYNVPVTFANEVGGTGFANGNVNVTLVAARFTPTEGGVIDPDFVITARLRMDLFCAQRLRDHLDEIIKKNTAPAGKPN